MTKSIQWVLLAAAMIIAGCAAHFDRYPGEKLSSIPEAIQGDYYFHDKPSFLYMFKKDSAAIRIFPDKIYPIPGSKAGGDPLVLGDSVVFTQFGNYYALSQRDENIPNVWTVSVIKADKNNLYVYSVEENKKYSEKLVTLFVNEALVRNTDGSYKKIVTDNPTKLRNMKASSSDTTIVFKMNEESLKLVFEKYLSKEKPLHLRRVK